MQDKITWFVLKYPSKDAKYGEVLWNEEFPTWGEAVMRCKELQALDPIADYEASDLPELGDVFQQDVVPVLEAQSATKH